jgi:transcription elongation GreA/GreB family factor
LISKALEVFLKGKIMDTPDIKRQKLEMWRSKLTNLERELEEILVRRGEAAREGDLRENAAYQMATEDADTWRVRIDEVKKIIAALEKGKK